MSSALVVSFGDLTTINIYSQVGLITLVGLIAKNGILIVWLANQPQASGFSRIAAQHQPLEPHATPDEVEPEKLTLAGAKA